LKGKINLEFISPTNKYTKHSFPYIILPYKPIRSFDFPHPRQVVLIRYKHRQTQEHSKTLKIASQKIKIWSRDRLPQRRHHIWRPVRLCLVRLKALVRDAIVGHELADSVADYGTPGDGASEGHAADGPGRWSDWATGWNWLAWGA